MIRQSLSQKMMNKLSPQQIQLMKLLQIPTATLDQRIKEELEANPALDEVDDATPEVFDIETEDSQDDVEFELDDYLKEYIEDDPISYKLKGDLYSTEDEKSVPVAVHESFHEQMERQIGMIDFENEEDKIVIKQIVGSIDEDGYLRREPESILDDLLFSQNIETTVDKVEELLKIVQEFEPPGIGARNLQESLMIQLRRKREKGECNNEAGELAMKILSEGFDYFTKKHYDKLKKMFKVSESELKDAIKEILKLNPKPASGLTNQQKDTSVYVVPDFIIRNNGGELELILNSKNAPDLRINDHYMEMLKGFNDNKKGKGVTKKEKEAVMFIKQKIDGAKWFIDAIKQRQDTLYRTMYAIMQFQKDFFLTGDDRLLKPMILKDIADITGLDISTVSRVANSKYVQTEFGTKLLKSFFSESMTTQDGKEVSTLQVKNILADIINREDKKKPHSDEKLKELLEQKGYSIARRTIAKYREQLGIPVARLRREL